VTQDQYTALIYAAEKGNVDCARLLIDAGADADAKDDVSC
jgi:ankyrin repeat protein